MGLHRFLEGQPAPEPSRSPSATLKTTHTHTHTRTHTNKQTNMSSTVAIQDGCYTFRRFQLPDAGVMEDTLAATFVITMAGSTERQSAIQAQLFERLHLTRTIYMVENAGFRHCAKPDLCEQQSNHDLLHANIAIFEYAEAAYPGQMIAVVEDDMLWTAEAVRTTKHWDHIAQFLRRHVDKMDHYLVGAGLYLCGFLPVLFDPRHIRLLRGSATQLVIHTPRGMSKVCAGYQSADRCKWTNWNHVDHLFGTHTAYTYFRPLAVQVFLETENSKVWKTGFHRFYHKLCGVDRIETVERGWDTARTIAIIVSVLVMLLVAYVAIALVAKCIVFAISRR